jgi:hypothetical protein
MPKKILTEDLARMIATSERLFDDRRNTACPYTEPEWKEVFQEAEEWFLEKDGEALYSFENIWRDPRAASRPHTEGLAGWAWREDVLILASFQTSRSRHLYFCRPGIKVNSQPYSE